MQRELLQCRVMVWRWTGGPLGVLLYEMMAGFPPFYDEEVTNTYKKILNGRFSFPSHFSVTARDLIRKLLQV